jgi:predicted CoA-binding protein
MIDYAQATDFLSHGSVAVVGASDDPRNFGRSVVKALADQGIPVVAVHPTATCVSGVPCHPTLAAVPTPIDRVVVMVGSAKSADVVRECVDCGIAKIWLFKGAGKGAVSSEALSLCHDHNVEVIAGACPLMFLEPVRGVHRAHRGIRRIFHGVSGPATKPPTL